MKLADILAHPLTNRLSKHTHDYGFYVMIAMFQKEFIILASSGLLVLVCISYVQWRFGLEGEKE